jgi:uncharacterized YigZ family protein
MIVPQGRSEAHFKEQRSEFIGLLFPLDSGDSFQSILKVLKSDYSKARHICWAYRIHDGNEITENSSDSGEPSGTAGIPILNQIRKKDAINIAVFVLRYFGGIKLGKRGLIDAHGKTAAETIQSAVFNNWNPMIELSIKADLKYYGDVLQVLAKFDGKILDNYSDSNLKLKINIPAEKRKILKESLIGGAFGDVLIKRSEREPNQGG